MLFLPVSTPPVLPDGSSFPKYVDKYLRHIRIELFSFLFSYDPKSFFRWHQFFITTLDVMASKESAMQRILADAGYLLPRSSLDSRFRHNVRDDR